MLQTTLQETIDRVLARSKTAAAPVVSGELPDRLRKLARALREVPATELTYEELYRVKTATDKADYSHMSEQERELSSENIRKHMHHLGRHPGGREQAIAIGLHQGEEGKREKAGAEKSKKCDGIGCSGCPECNPKKAKK